MALLSFLAAAIRFWFHWELGAKLSRRGEPQCQCEGWGNTAVLCAAVRGGTRRAAAFGSEVCLSSGLWVFCWLFPFLSYPIRPTLSLLRFRTWVHANHEVRAWTPFCLKGGFKKSQLIFLLWDELLKTENAEFRMDFLVAFFFLPGLEVTMTNQEGIPRSRFCFANCSILNIIPLLKAVKTLSFHRQQ